MSDNLQQWKIKDLKPHPKQKEFFDDLPFHLLRDLAQDIKDRGLTNAVEILPDGTIVCGHQRTRAAEMLGWEEIDVWVNHELATQGDFAVEQRLIEDNLVGRKLDRLDRVRCYKRLGEMAGQTPEERKRSHQYGRLRDVVALRMGMSGRTLERYERVLAAPREVQDAFRAGRISLVNAGKIARLPKDVQEKLVADLQAGTDAKQAVQARLKGRSPSPLDAVLGPFIRSLERNVPPMEDLAGQVKSLSKYDIFILERAHTLIGQLLQQVAKKKPDVQRKKKSKKGK